MTDRYIVTNRRGQPIVRTSSLFDAKRALMFLGGRIIDRAVEPEEPESPRDSERSEL